MPQFAVIYGLSHVAIGFSCLWVLGLIVRLWRQRNGAPAYPFAALAVSLWVGSEVAVHASILVSLSIKIPLIVLVLTAINAVAAVIGAVSLRAMAVDLMRLPGIQQQKATCDALARTVGELTTEREQ